MARRRLRAGARPGRGGPRLPRPAPGPGGRRGAGRHRRACRPVGPAVRSAARLAVAAATLAVLVWRLGTGPFLDGLRTVDARALAAAAGLAVATTLCCAWRWRIVARGLGLDLPLGAAGAADYRPPLLNPPPPR